MNASLDPRLVGTEAYVYAYPLVTMDVTRRQTTNVAPGAKVGMGPMNTFTHIREFPTAEFKAVVRPNFDTLYSSAWVDVTEEPMVVSAPAVVDGRYYQLPMLDMWTDVFAAPGQRTSGSAAADWALVPHRWNGELPEGVVRVDAPTPYVWIIGRTQTNGPDDYPAVREIQDAYKLTPLSAWGGEAPSIEPTTDPDIDMRTPPLVTVNAMSAETYFDTAMRLMALHPPHLTDWSLVEQMRRIGLVPGGTFAGLAADVRTALADVPAAAQQAMRAAFPRLANFVNGWQMNTDTMGVYGNFYLKRAVVTMVGLGANPAEDALYPLLFADADGEALVGERDYLIHFAADALPPVDAFWSITMYDAEGFQVANDLDRFAIGDRDALRYNADGSLDIYVQHRSPGAGKESNWLPSPTGPLGITMRLYSPKEPALVGGWAPPPVTKA